LVSASAEAEARESSPPSPIRVVLAEDHALLRSSLRVLLDVEEGLEVVAEANDLQAALRHVHGEGPRVLVLDLGMISDAARETIGKLRAQAPGTQVVILTMHESPVVAQHVLAAGALGVVLKDQADGELAPAVRAAARGERYVSPRVADRLAAALRSSLAQT
jgi:two-component system, NarL family, response regulator NreC